MQAGLAPSSESLWFRILQKMCLLHLTLGGVNDLNYEAAVSSYDSQYVIIFSPHLMDTSAHAKVCEIE